MDGEGDWTYTCGATVMSMPRVAEAVSVELTAVAIELCTVVTSVSPGTLMMAVMTTLPPLTTIVTYSGSTPAAAATLACKSVVST